MDAVTHLAPTVGFAAACEVLAVARASFYRQRPVLGPPASPAPEPALPAERPAPARALSSVESAGVLSVLHEDRFHPNHARELSRIRPAKRGLHLGTPKTLR